MTKRKTWEELTDREKAFVKEEAKNLLKSIDKMKEVQRIQYDYFKHLTTLSTGSILIIVAFLEKVFSSPHLIGLAVASIISLAFCLVGSLLAMPAPANVILYTTEHQVLAQFGEKEEEAWKSYNKIKKSFKTIGFYDYFTKITFILGIGLFLAFAFFNFLK